MPSLDAADRRILNQLRLNGRLTNSALSEIVGLSPSACLRRVKLLEQSGIIRGYVAIVSDTRPDEGIVAIVQVELEKQNEEYLARFEKAIIEQPDIQDWHLMSGAHDYILRVRIANINEYGLFHRDVLSRLPGVSRITSSFAIRSHSRTI